MLTKPGYASRAEMLRAAVQHIEEERRAPEDDVNANLRFKGGVEIVRAIAEEFEGYAAVQPVTIVCVLRSGGGIYDSTWVAALRSAVKKWAPTAEFVCLSDVDCGEGYRPLPHPEWKGYWSLINWFKPGQFPGRVIAVGLDTLIVGDISELMAYEGPLAAISDLMVPRLLASGVMTWYGDEAAPIYNAFRKDPRGIMAKYPRMDPWLRTVIPKAARLQDSFPGQIVSFKVHARQRAPVGAKIVCFHGRPSITELAESNWARREWDSHLTAGVTQAAAAAPVPTGPIPPDQRVLIVGGGSNVWEDLRALEELIGHPWDGVVIAVNDIGCHYPGKVDHWVTLHSEKLLGWQKLRASKGHTDKPRTWSRPGASRKTDDHCQPWGGGSSGLLAVAVAERLGFRRAVLCGLPMTTTPHFAESTVHVATRPWKSADAHWRPWNRFKDRMQLFARSMSGRTEGLLGRPDREWLMGAEAPAPEIDPAVQQLADVLDRRDEEQPYVETFLSSTTADMPVEASAP